MIRSLDSIAAEGNVDRPVFELTQDEFDLISRYSFPETEEERAQIVMLLEAKGIKVNSGDIDVRVDGVLHKITTVSNDFGTIINDESTPVIRSGFEEASH